MVSQSTFPEGRRLEMWALVDAIVVVVAFLLSRAIENSDLIKSYIIFHDNETLVNRLRNIL